MFGESSKTDIYYNPAPGKRAFSTPSLSSKDMTSLSAVLWLNLASSSLPVEILLEEQDLVDGGSVDPPKIITELSKEMLPDHLWPSGHFLYTTSGNYAVAHQGEYGVGIFKEKEGNFTKLNSFGFTDAGGENIGSLFRYNDELYASVRVNLRYHFRSQGGHGYRYPGVYHISVTNNSVEEVANASLIVQHTDDAQCCAECGGCFEDKEFTNNCEVNSDTWWDCLSRPKNMKARDWSLTKNWDCQKNASQQLGDLPCEFSAYYLCVHKCRAHGERYHSAVSKIGGGLFGLLSNRLDNSVTACRLGAKSLKFFCFDDPLVFLKNSKPTHPVMSSLVETQNQFTLLEMVTTDMKKPDPSKPNTVAHSWNRENFCSLVQQNPSFPGSVTVSIRFKGHLFVVFSPVSSLRRSCEYTCTVFDGNISLQMSSVNRIVNYFSTLEAKRHINANASNCLCSKSFDFSDLCEVENCEARFTIDTIRIHGLYASDSN